MERSSICEYMIPPLGSRSPPQVIWHHNRFTGLDSGAAWGATFTSLLSHYGALIPASRMDIARDNGKRVYHHYSKVYCSGQTIGSLLLHQKVLFIVMIAMWLFLFKMAYKRTHKWCIFCASYHMFTAYYDIELITVQIRTWDSKCSGRSFDEK